MPFSSAESNAVSLVDDWSGVSASDPTTKSFENTLAPVFANEVKITPTVSTWRNSSPGVWPIAPTTNAPGTGKGADALAVRSPFQLLQLNFRGSIDFEFDTPLDSSSGIVTMDIDVTQEALDFVFLDADNACVTPATSWVHDIGGGPTSGTNNYTSTADLTLGTKDGCTTLAFKGIGVRDNPLLLIVPGADASVSTLRIYSSPGGSNTSAWALAFAQSGSIQNVPPTANDDNQTAAPGASVTATVLGNDEAVSTPGATGAALDPASVELVGATTPDGKTQVVPDEGTWTVNANGSLTFEPESGFSGSPSPVQYTVADEAGDRSGPATVTVTVAAPPRQTAPSHPCPHWVNGACCCWPVS